MAKKQQRKVRKPAAQAKAKSNEPSIFSKHGHHMLLGAIILFLLIVRLKLLGMPFERDEGGFAYIGKMALDGVPLYSELYDIKLPGLYYIYGLFAKIFGYSPSGIHFGLLLFNVGATIMTFMIGQRLFSKTTAVIAAATFAIMSVGPNMLGFAAHATQLLSLPALAGIYLLIKALDTSELKTFLFAGLLFGIAFTIKQQAVYYMLFAGIYTIYVRYTELTIDWTKLVKEEAALIVGSLAPFILVVLWMSINGRFDEFWFWTFEFPRAYAANSISFAQASGVLMDIQLPRVTQGQSLLWGLGIIGLVVSFFANISTSKKVFLALFFVMMIGGVATGFAFYQHYFVMFLPVIGLLCGVLVETTGEALEKMSKNKWVWAVPFGVFFIAWIQVIGHDSNYFFSPDYETILRQHYGGNPFWEDKKVGEYIKTQTTENDQIIVFGSEAQIYTYADRKAASGHMMVYPLVDGGPHSVTLQDQMIADVQKNQPAYLVYVEIMPSWLSRDPENRLQTWMRSYVDQNYMLDGLVDIGDNQSIYKWGDEARQYRPQSPKRIVVFKKK